MDPTGFPVVQIQNTPVCGRGAAGLPYHCPKSAKEAFIPEMVHFEIK